MSLLFFALAVPLVIAGLVLLYYTKVALFWAAMALIFGFAWIFDNSTPHRHHHDE